MGDMALSYLVAKLSSQDGKGCIFVWGIGAFPCLASYLCAYIFIYTDQHTRTTYIFVYSDVRPCAGIC